MKLDFNDVLVMSGLGLLGTGLWWIEPAASLIGVGLMTLIIALLRAMWR